MRLDWRDLLIATSVSQSPWQTSTQWGHSRRLDGQVLHLYTMAPQAKLQEVNLPSTSAPLMLTKLGLKSIIAIRSMALNL